MSDRGQLAWIAFWQFGSIGTFIKLTWFDGYIYNAWNWIIAIPTNLFLGEIWPVYWLLVKPLVWMING